MSERNKETVGKINKALSAGNYELFFDFCADDFTFTIAGERTIKGKEAARKFMASMAAESPAPPKITPIDPILDDGDFVAARGTMSMKNKQGKEEFYPYCDIYRFRGDKIAELNSYIVKDEAQSKTNWASSR